MGQQDLSSRRAVVSVAQLTHLHLLVFYQSLQMRCFCPSVSGFSELRPRQPLPALFPSLGRATSLARHQVVLGTRWFLHIFMHIDVSVRRTGEKDALSP